jgi:hypothetical protein
MKRTYLVITLLFLGCALTMCVIGVLKEQIPYMGFSLLCIGGAMIYYKAYKDLSAQNETSNEI